MEKKKSVIIILSLLVFIFFASLVVSKNLNRSVDNKRKYKDIYCLFNNDGVTPDANDKNWKLAENNECSTLLDDKVYYGFLKNYDGKITVIKDASEYGKITKLEVSKEKIYVAKNGVYNLTATSEKIGNVMGKINVIKLKGKTI